MGVGVVGVEGKFPHYLQTISLGGIPGNVTDVVGSALAASKMMRNNGTTGLRLMANGLH